MIHQMMDKEQRKKKKKKVLKNSNKLQKPIMGEKSVERYKILQD